MYQLKRLIIYAHVILIYFTFIYSSRHQHSISCETIETTEPSLPVTLEATTPDSDEQIRSGLSDDKIKIIRQHFRDIAKERLFDIKGQPSQPTADGKENTKFYVPRAMLEKYLEFRDTVREVIPNDKDFYGKIDIDDIDVNHEDMWSAIYNKYGSYDIQVDLSPPEDGLSGRRFHYKGDASHIAHIPPERDPEDVPSNIEPILPPHSRSVKNKKHFISVHLRFNLSQEVYSSPNAADDLKGAELHLTRDKISDCDIYDCDRKPVPFFNRKDNARTTKDDDDSNQHSNSRIMPRHQRVYLLQVLGYDEFDEPKTRVVASLRVDTRQTTPLIFNIFSIVKLWLMDPKSNYGIIVRVSNDDAAFEQALALKKVSRVMTGSHNTKRDLNSTFTNTSTTNIDYEIPFQPDEIALLEHVRLKRSFKSASDDDETWLHKQPSILLFSKPDDSTRKHVKRHHEDAMQADESSDTTAVNQHQTSSPASTLPNSSDISEPHRQIDKSNNAHDSMNAQVVRKEHSTTPSSTNTRRPSQSNRGSSRARASSQSSRPKGKGKPSTRQADKCSKRSLAINFDEVGWSSWIIAPHAYYANYCAGDCSWPLSDAQNATNHAIIQAIYHSVGRVVPKSSCAPVKLGRMAILYQLDGIVQMRQYDDMIVEACGCL